MSDFYSLLLPDLHAYGLPLYAWSTRKLTTRQATKLHPNPSEAETHVDLLERTLSNSKKILKSNPHLHSA